MEEGEKKIEEKMDKPGDKNVEQHEEDELEEDKNVEEEEENAWSV